MEAYEGIIATLALTMGASWASGINLYAVLLMLGLGGTTGHIDLPQDLTILSNPLVLSAAALMYCVEFFADKIPGVDTGWDTLHTFVRIPAGAILASNAIGDVGPVMEMASAIVGGGLAATSHATKAGSRLLINTSPEPVSNLTASIGEDLLVLGGLWTALNHPTVFLVLLLMFLILAIWLLPKLWRLIKIILQKIKAFFGGTKPVGFEGLVFEPSARAKPSISNPVAELERLKALLDSGVLTQDEFNKAKQKILE